MADILNDIFKLLHKNTLLLDVIIVEESLRMLWWLHCLQQFTAWGHTVNQDAQQCASKFDRPILSLKNIGMYLCKDGICLFE